MIVDSGNRIIFSGNGETTEFPFSFEVVAATDVKVAISDTETGEVAVLTADYFVDVAGEKVIYPGYPPGSEPNDEDVPPILPAGKTLVVYREVPLTQESDLGEVYPFNTIERGLDKNCILIQQIADAQARSLSLPVSTPFGFSAALPTPAPGTSFRVNDAGNGYEMTMDPALVLPAVESLKSDMETLKSETEEIKEEATSAASTAAADAAAEAAVNAVADVQTELEAVVTEVNAAKTTAVASAATATTKASEAQTASATATTKASEASASATQANTASSSASASATQAQSASATATTKATEAASSASTATVSANAAQSAATTVAGYMSSIADSVDEVTTAKTSALAAASSAAVAAETATSKASAAETAESNAAQSAAEAAQSAADAAAAAGGDYIPSSQKGGINGVATLDGTGNVPTTQLANVISTLAPVATSGSYADLTGTPGLATVATSGKYVDLTGKPSIPSKVSQLTNDTGFITGVSWTGVTGKPSTFTPSAHTHAAADVSGLATVATSGSYNSLTGKPSIPSKVSQLTNDTGFITGVSWTDVTGKPTNFITGVSAVEVNAATGTSLSAGVADSDTDKDDSTKKLATTEWINNQIVESGTNANGTWVKYANGLMEQWGWSLNTGATTETVFPQPFVATERADTTVTVLPSNTSSANVAVIENATGLSPLTTYFSWCSFYNNAYATTASTVAARWYAKGWWRK